MKLFYETPYIEMIIFKKEDIIVTSSGNFGSDGDDFVGEW